MKQFKVIALHVGGLNNKIFNAGDVVTEDNFPEGNAQLLVDNGFLKEIGKAKKQEEVEVEETETETETEEEVEVKKPKAKAKRK